MCIYVDYIYTCLCIKLNIYIYIHIGINIPPPKVFQVYFWGDREYLFRCLRICYMYHPPIHTASPKVSRLG